MWFWTSQARSRPSERDATLDVPTELAATGVGTSDVGIGWLVVRVFPVGPQGSLALPTCRVGLVLVQTDQLGDRVTEIAEPAAD